MRRPSNPRNTRAWSVLAGLAAALALLTGCPATDDDDSAGDDDITGGTALYGYDGEAIADAALGFDGHEELYVIADEGDGAELCRIRYPLADSAPRDDCDACRWAFELTAGPAEVIAEGSVGCDALGYDDTAVAELLAAPRAYGYAEEYFGHANVLMVEQGGTWDAVTFVAWSEQTGALSYDWDVGYLEYDAE